MFRIRRLNAVAVAVVAVMFGGVVQAPAAKDSTLVPIEQIPQLSESYDLTDYREVFANGTLFPDRVSWDSVSVRTGGTEASLAVCLPDSSEFSKSEEARTREQQWQFLRGLLHHNYTSMHYYILVPICYYQQLAGRFKSYEWKLTGVGTIRVHLHASAEAEVFHVWLIELAMDSTGLENVRYAHPPDMVLVRDGEPRVEWDVDKNRVTITR